MTRDGMFTAVLWRAIDPIFAAIRDHPFVTGLTDGTLDRRSFMFYAVQDALYLTEFARALSVAAARAPQEGWIVTFNEHAAGALKVERMLHESFFRDVGLSEEAVRSTPMAPTNVAYTSYLLAVAYARPFHELVAALLPCYWIYWEVGKALAARGSREGLYQRWIETYAADEFGGLVDTVLRLTNEQADALDAGARAAMTHHFVTTSRYEWMFWEMGYRQERWPV